MFFIEEEAKQSEFFSINNKSYAVVEFPDEHNLFEIHSLNEEGFKVETVLTAIVNWDLDGNHEVDFFRGEVVEHLATIDSNNGSLRNDVISKLKELILHL